MTTVLLCARNIIMPLNRHQYNASCDETWLTEKSNKFKLMIDGLKIGVLKIEFFLVHESNLLLPDNIP